MPHGESRFFVRVVPETKCKVGARQIHTRQIDIVGGTRRLYHDHTQGGHITFTWYHELLYEFGIYGWRRDVTSAKSAREFQVLGDLAALPQVA